MSRAMRSAESLTRLQSVSLGPFWVSPASSYSLPHKQILCDAFTAMIQSLIHLTSLELGSSEAVCSGYNAYEALCASLLPAVAVKMSRVLPRMRHLRSLKLECHCEMRFLGCQELLEGLQNCTGLQSLTLRGVAVVSAAATNNSRKFPHQQLSWSRQQGTGRLTAAWRRGTAELAAGDCSGTWAFGAALACMTGSSPSLSRGWT